MLMNMGIETMLIMTRAPFHGHKKDTWQCARLNEFSYQRACFLKDVG